MVGRQVLLELDKPPARPQAAALQVRGLSVKDDRGLPAVKDVSFEVRAGEIVGVAGVEGNGQAELIEALAGLRLPAAGSIALGAKDVTRATPRQRFHAGLAHVPADRLARGVVADYDLADNLILGSQRDQPFARGPWLVKDAIRRHAVDLLKLNDVRPPLPHAAVRTLSGGNQQKLVVGRELWRRAGLLIAAHPTRGVDLGAVEFIHRRLIGERERGAGVLLVSSELSELLSLSDRLLVLYEGRIVYETAPEATNERALGLCMSGHAPADSPA